jgi:hypothetical protein
VRKTGGRHARDDDDDDDDEDADSARAARGPVIAPTGDPCCPSVRGNADAWNA